MTIPATARSTAIQFGIDTLLTGTAPTSTEPWLTLTFTDLAPGTVQFMITSSLEVQSEFISNIVFNVDPSLTPSLINFGTISKTGTFNDPTITKSTQDAQSLNPADNFDIALNFSISNANGGAHRFNNNDIASWNLTYDGPSTFNANSFNFFNTESQEEFSGFYAVAYFQGIPTGEGSGKLGDSATPVPEPSTLLLLGVGLVGLGILGRRKFRR